MTVILVFLTGTITSRNCQAKLRITSYTLNKSSQVILMPTESRSVCLGVGHPSRDPRPLLSLPFSNYFWAATDLLL
jgi:hypothetical protein